MGEIVNAGRPDEVASIVACSKVNALNGRLLGKGLPPVHAVHALVRDSADVIDRQYF
jgi:hypothetical protein